MMYEKLGQSKGPSVVYKVVLAFLTPIFVFILSLFIAEKLLAHHFEKNTLTLITFFLALFVTLIVVFVIRAIRKPSDNGRENIEHCKQR